MQVFFARSKSGSSLFPQYGMHLIYSSRCKLLDKATPHTLSTPQKLLFKRITKDNKAWGDVKVMSWWMAWNSLFTFDAKGKEIGNA